MLGIHGKNLQEKLLKIENPDLNTVVELCKANEVTKYHIIEVQSNDGVKTDAVRNANMRMNNKSGRNENQAVNFD